LTRPKRAGIPTVEQLPGGPNLEALHTVYGDYGCCAAARGTTCPAPAAIRADWLDEYTVSRYREAFAVDGEVTREQLLKDGVRVSVAKGRSGGGPERLAGPDTSRLTFTIGSRP
jgi:hypothetical protein